MDVQGVMDISSDEEASQEGDVFEGLPAVPRKDWTARALFSKNEDETRAWLNKTGSAAALPDKDWLQQYGVDLADQLSGNEYDVVARQVLQRKENLGAEEIIQVRWSVNPALLSRESAHGTVTSLLRTLPSLTQEIPLRNFGGLHGNLTSMHGYP